MRKETLKFAVLLAVALGSAPVSAQMWKWSQTATNNATADPSINWSEGMSPSSVNDSSRAMMAATARWRDDISGALNTTGSATAYVVTTNEGLQTPTPVDGQMIAFTPHVTNGSAATMAADGGTAYPLQTGPGAAVVSATLIQGTPYTIKFSSSANAWVLRHFYGNPYSVPLGGGLIYDGTTAPNSSFIFPVGQCLSRTVYAAYFAQVGTSHGACDGTTTFAALDMRGRVPAAPDNMGGTAANVLPGYVQNFTGGAASFNLNLNQIPNFAPAFTGALQNLSFSSADGTFVRGGVQNYGGGSGPFVSGQGVGQVTVSGNYQPIGSVASINGGQAQQPTSNIQPTYAINYIIRVL